MIPIKEGPMKKKNIPLFLLRLALFLLILTNAALIFHFSAQDGEKSSQQSDRLESAVIDVILTD